MNQILSSLHQDHIYLESLLKVMDEQIACIASGDEINLTLLIDITDYIQHYSDLVHHPKEDVVYEYYIETYSASVDQKDIVQQVSQEHHVLPDQTISFRELLEGLVYGDGIFTKDELKNKIVDFVNRQREHMNKEESSVFPLLNESLTDADWDKIAVNLQDDKDPLFGDIVLKKYEDLSNWIQENID